MSRRLAALVVSGALAVGGLSGCGDDPVASYCTRLQADQQKFAAMLEGTPTGLVTNLPMLRDLASVAPEDLTDEWQTFITAVEGLSDALHQAGLKPSDFASGEPKGLSVEQRRTVSEAADALAADDVVAAGNGIEQQARDVCKVQLGF